MAINRISRLYGCGVFRDFKWPADLLDFNRYNLIYGWNGSGKTTISRLFRMLETRTEPADGRVSLSINGRDVGGDRFPQETLPIRVFNRDFVTDNVFPAGGGDMPLILVIGEENIEKQKRVEQYKTNLVKAEAERISAEGNNQEADKALDKFYIDRARLLKDMLKSSGSNPYNNYDKADFRKSVEELANAGGGNNYLLDDPDREKLIAQHRASQKQRINELTYRFPKLETLLEAASQSLSTTVVSTVIQTFKDDPVLSAWIHQGLRLHKDRATEKCLFCEQPLPIDRMEALEAHFSTEYEKLLKRLETDIAQLQEGIDVASTLVLPNRAELYEDLVSEFDVAEVSLREAINATKDFLNSLIRVLSEKKGRPFESLYLDVTTPEIDIGTIDSLNETIRKHNQACDDFQTRVDEARKQLAANFVAGDLVEFLELKGAVQRSEVSAKQASDDVNCLRDEIARLEREIEEHHQPAEELNEDLHKYLGYDELCLDIKDTGYTITRSGVPAKALSEGEMTAVALLYFLKSLQDRRFDLANGVIVLDDPVSSLDTNSLYLAFGFIRERTQRAAQLFILTHNFTFFRQVRYWFHHLKGQNKKDVSKRPARFYMLNCSHDQDLRCARIQSLDPLLEQYDSEYHYLYACIYREATRTPTTGLEQNYMLPNMARRLLEAFLAFRQPHVSGDLTQKVQALQFDEAKKVRILRFLHTYSHNSSVGEPEHDLSILSEARTVLNDLLDLIKSQDPVHFSSMEQLIAPAVDGEEDE